MKYVGGAEHIKLSSGLLDLILMVQSVAKTNCRVSMFNKNHGLKDFDWFAETEKFFNNIDKNILEKYKLSTNIMSFEKVYYYKVTKDIIASEETQLEHYIF